MMYVCSSHSTILSIYTRRLDVAVGYFPRVFYGLASFLVIITSVVIVILLEFY